MRERRDRTAMANCDEKRGEKRGNLKESSAERGERRGGGFPGIVIQRQATERE